MYKDNLNINKIYGKISHSNENKQKKKHKNVQFITTYVKIKLIKENRQKKGNKKITIISFCQDKSQ